MASAATLPNNAATSTAVTAATATGEFAEVERIGHISCHK